MNVRPSIFMVQLATLLCRLGMMASRDVRVGRHLAVAIPRLARYSRCTIYGTCGWTLAQPRQTSGPVIHNVRSSYLAYPENFV